MNRKNKFKKRKYEEIGVEGRREKFYFKKEIFLERMKNLHRKR